MKVPEFRKKAQRILNYQAAFQLTPEIIEWQHPQYGYAYTYQNRLVGYRDIKTPLNFYYAPNSKKVMEYVKNAYQIRDQWQKYKLLEIH